jgi:TetR/AcrR family transcriptional repressor of lmrAB and yxaGH operons
MARPRSDSRRKIISSARTLFRRQGYHGTGLAQIIEHSGAPRGSVYFLFPDGKEQIAVEAVNEWATELEGLIRSAHARSATAVEWLEAMAGHFAEELRASGFTEGLPVSTITLDAVPESAALTRACRSAYDGWIGALADGLTDYAVAEDRADDLAQLILANLEGTVLLCRLYQSTAPLERVKSFLFPLLER